LEVSFTGDGSTDDIGVTDYLWDFGDGNISMEANPVHTFTDIGVLDVVLTVTDDEGLLSTDTLTITVNEDNDSLEEPSFEFILAPNPSTEYVEIFMSDNFNIDDIIGVMLHDSAGRLIRQYMITDVLQGRVMRIPTNTYRNELYLMTVIFNNNEPVSKRLVIQN
jgi:PKD repeat protein